MSTAVPAPCDPALAATSGAHPGPHAGLTLAASVLASSLAFIDGSVVNVALPTIGRALAADAAGQQWILNAYLLPLSALLLLGGAAGDGYGRRRVFFLGIAAFTAGSATCAAAPSLGVLLAGRALQGIGAAMLTPQQPCAARLCVLGRGAREGDRHMGRGGRCRGGARTRGGRVAD